MAPFRLSALLRFRQTERDASRAELARAIEARRQLERQTAELDAHLEQLRDHTRLASAPGAVDVDKLLSVHRYLLLQQVQRQQLLQQAAQVDAEIDRRRQKLVEADRELRIIEKLRDRHHKQSQQRELYRQQQQIDEVAGQRRRRAVLRAADAEAADAVEGELS